MALPLEALIEWTVRDLEAFRNCFGGVKPSDFSAITSSLGVETHFPENQTRPTIDQRVDQTASPQLSFLNLEPNRAYFENKNIAVFPSPKPIASNHLWVVLKGCHQSIEDLSIEEVSDLGKTLTKIVHLMKKEFRKGCVVSFSSMARSSELKDKLVVNILPSQKDDIQKDVVTKLDSHLYVCTGSGIVPRPDVLQIDGSIDHTTFWQTALLKPFNEMVSVSNDEITAWEMQTSGLERSKVALIDQIFREGFSRGVFEPIELSQSLNLQQIPADHTTSKHLGCAFCLPNVIAKQQVTETSYFRLLYQQRPQVIDGHFLLIPKRHVRHLQSLTAAEWQDLFNLQKKVGAFFHRHFKANQASFYIQNDPDVGMTVPHFHMHAIVGTSTRGEVLLNSARYMSNHACLSQDIDYQRIKKLWKKHIE